VAVDVRFSSTQEVEVGAVEEEDLFSWHFENVFKRNFGLENLMFFG
jgi:hypothetical protein